MLKEIDIETIEKRIEKTYDIVIENTIRDTHIRKEDLPEVIKKDIFIKNIKILIDKMNTVNSEETIKELGYLLTKDDKEIELFVKHLLAQSLKASMLNELFNILKGVL